MRWCTFWIALLGIIFLDFEPNSFAQKGSKKESEKVGLARRFTGHDGPVLAVDISPDGKKIISGGYDKTLRVWDSATGKKLYVIEGQLKGRPCVMSYLDIKSSPGKLAVVGFQTHEPIIVWDTQSKNVIRELGGFGHGTVSLSVTPDGKYVAAGCADGQAYVWDAATGAKIRSFDGRQGRINGVALSPDGKKVVCASDDDGSMRMWDIQSGKQLIKFRSEEGRSHVSAIRFTPDGKKIVTGHDAGMIRILDAADQDAPEVLKGHEGRVHTLAISADGARLLSGGEDKTVRLWDLKFAKEIQSFTEHAKPVSAVAFSKDGKRAVSASHDESVILWNLPAK